jgi:hypothetical protein
VGILGLAQGFVALAVSFLPAEPNATLAKWLFVGAAVCIVACLLIFVWPQRTEEATQTTTQSGSRNVQIQGEIVNFQGTISTGEGEVPSARLSDGRTLVDVTPEYLMGLYDGHTSIQAAKLVEAFIGKWLRVSGPLEDVTANGMVFFESGAFGSTTALEMRFNDRIAIENDLRILRKGDQITVIEQIERVSSTSVQLENCELEKP